MTFQRARWNKILGEISAVAVRENVWEPPKLGLISGYWLLAIVDIPEYSALSEAIVKLTGEGMGKIVNNPQSD